MAAPIVYTSADAGAPVINSTTGAWADGLKAILVDGYGTKAAAGWTLEFSGAGTGGDNQPRVFRPGAGVRHYFYVNENQVFPSNQYQIFAWETMTGILPVVGTHPWQTPGGTMGSFGRCNTAGVHKWIAIADNRTIYFFLNTNPSGGDNYDLCLAFGSFWTYNNADLYAGFCWDMRNPINMDIMSAMSGNSRVPRNFTGAVPAPDEGIPLCLCADRAKAGNSGDGLHGFLPFPHPPDSRIWLSPFYVGGYNAGPAVRGKLRGMWQWLHPAAAVADRDTFNGAGAFAGKSFILIRPIPNSAGSGVVAIETTDTWLTNP